MYPYGKQQKGFTLVEVLVGTALFLVVGIAVYGAFASLFQLANTNQARILGVELADEQFEIIRNMPYVNVGLTNGIPQGVLPQTQTLVRGGFTFTVTLVIRNENLSTSTVQASSKLVEVDVTCPTCEQNFPPIALTGQVSPANLQSAASGGALIIQVADSSGNTIQGATVTVQSTATSTVTDTDVTNDSGVLEIIGVPPGVGVYHITATKAGYTTDQTSPDANVLQGQATQVNLSIDKLSILNISSVDPACGAAPNFHFHLSGQNQYSHDLVTDGTGSLTLNPMQGDTYTLTSSDTNNDINGITPFSPFKLVPGSTQSVQLVVIPANENSLIVPVEDSGTKLPLSGATVELSNTEYGGSYDQPMITGQGYFDQTDWSHGPNQQSFSDPRAYASESGVDTSTSSGSIILFNDIFDPYNTSATGTLDSSTFDTGTTSNFYALNWSPAPGSQPTLAGPSPVMFQFATAPSTTPSGPWNFIGPDGTSGSYYTQPGQQISFPPGGDEFARYRLFMTTQTATVTPSVNDISFTYTSGCNPPGQVVFQGLSAGKYALTVSKAGYSPQTVDPVTIIGGWQQSQTIQLGP